jgi:hypothetical protein
MPGMMQIQGPPADELDYWFGPRHLSDMTIMFDGHTFHVHRMMLETRTAHWGPSRPLPEVNGNIMVPEIFSSDPDSGKLWPLSYGAMHWFWSVLYDPASHGNVPQVLDKMLVEPSEKVSFEFPKTVCVTVKFNWAHSLIVMARYFDCQFVVDRCERVLDCFLMTITGSVTSSEHWWISYTWELLLVADTFKLPLLRANALKALSETRHSLSLWLTKPEHYGQVSKELLFEVITALANS